MRKDPLIILGMHRSGTSILSKTNHSAGVNMGWNQRGQGESHIFQIINRDLLSRNNSNWYDVDSFIELSNDEKFIDNELDYLTETYLKKRKLNKHFYPLGHLLPLNNKDQWGWKDPRTSITIPVWKKIFPEAKIIYMLRNGIDVAISLHYRETGANKDFWENCPNCKEFQYCFNLWDKYSRSIDNNITNMQNVIRIKYEDFLLDPFSTIKDIYHQFNYEFNEDKLKIYLQNIKTEKVDNSKKREIYKDHIQNLNNIELLNEYGYGS